MTKTGTRIYKAKANVKDIAGVIFSALPHQGAIEVQRDVPRKEHAWHDHQVDETISDHLFFFRIPLLALPMDVNPNPEPLFL